jgi:hypothetical protein
MILGPTKICSMIPNHRVYPSYTYEMQWATRLDNAGTK